MNVDMSAPLRHVLFVHTRNSTRSIRAEGLLNPGSPRQ
jgi:protein-tyrosine-phosphatase